MSVREEIVPPVRDRPPVACRSYLLVEHMDGKQHQAADLVPVATVDGGSSLAVPLETLGGPFFPLRDPFNPQHPAAVKENNSACVDLGMILTRLWITDS